MRSEELVLLAAMLHMPLEAIKTNVVEDIADGGMGSIRFVHESSMPRLFGSTVVEAEYIDSDGIVVSITVSLDNQGDLYEVDFWKVDFSPLLKYPLPQQLRLKTGD
ncbi:hypothetical protein QWZ03_02805 [Chitinimonas viridis]|uniref:DUF6984 domain-containing protein n=1 Tax=Chitinimonas viridis TaxID=664880 RepID=A0ABT8B2H9_9NEIS|nr:hypothetical protein [Chitinimonas viridis]MDN3575699.1 hypothetical protein [Chitinimonas viridis]